MPRKGLVEVRGVKKVEETSRDVAAFFDLDGTLVALPSMEMRFFRSLRNRREIAIQNYLLWLREAARLLPRGIQQIAYANKMHLRGVLVDAENRGTDIPARLSLIDETRRKEGEKRQARMPVPLFYAQGIELVAWHAQRGHTIVLVSGTLEALAQAAALALHVRLGVRGIAASIGVSATRLEETGGRWTGRIVGEAMFGEEKARAVRRLAARKGLDLARCFAYGDSAADRRMLEAVGRPAAVNPSHDLARIAWQNSWPVLLWGEEKNSTQSAQRPRGTERTYEEMHAVRAKSGCGA